MTEMTSPSHLSPDHQPRVFTSTTPSSTSPSSAYSSSTLPPSFVSSPYTAHSSGQSSYTLCSSICPSTKPLTSPTVSQSSTLFSPVSHSFAQSTLPTSGLKASTLPPASAFTPICPASSHSSTQSSSHNLSSTPSSTVPPRPQMPLQEPRTSSNQLSVSSSHNSLDGEVQVSDIYFVSSC